MLLHISLSETSVSNSLNKGRTSSGGIKKIYGLPLDSDGAPTFYQKLLTLLKNKVIILVDNLSVSLSDSNIMIIKTNFWPYILLWNIKSPHFCGLFLLYFKQN